MSSTSNIHLITYCNVQLYPLNQAPFCQKPLGLVSSPWFKCATAQSIASKTPWTNKGNLRHHSHAISQGGTIPSNLPFLQVQKSLSNAYKACNSYLRPKLPAFSSSSMVTVSNGDCLQILCTTSLEEPCSLAEAIASQMPQIVSHLQQELTSIKDLKVFLSCTYNATT